MAKLRTITLTFLLAGAAYATPLMAEAATLYVSPPSGNYYKGENFEVHVLVSSDVTINAVSSVLGFPTRHLKVVEISKKRSIFNFWVEEPSFSNSGEFGNIRFEGVILNPGFTGNGGEIATITFRADDVGAADVTVAQSSILANDGQGTNVAASATGAHFTVLPQRVAPPPPSAQTTENAQTPQVIFVKQLSQESRSDILSFWETVPGWVKASVLIFIGLATIVCSLIILSFGAVVLLWLWSAIWHRRYQFLAVLRLPAHLLKNVVFKTARLFGMAERELKGDVRYGVQRLAEEFKDAPHAPSFKILLKEYFFVVYDIVRRFVTTENPKGDPRPEAERKGQAEFPST